MKAALAQVDRLRAPALAALLLALGLVVGFTVASQSAPPPRPTALLWDDYILAVATLYQRDGDLDAARERLAKLATDDPASSVEALAAVYVPDGPVGESAATALRNFAVALTGRTAPLPTVLGGETPAPSTVADSNAGPRSLLRSQTLWGAVCLLSLGLLGITYLRRRPAVTQATAAVAVGEAARPALATASAVSGTRRPRPTWQSVQPVAVAPVEHARREAEAPSSPHVSIAFTYAGGSGSVEEMTPILDPRTGKPIAGCGMTNGPAADGGVEGYLGILVWLHELGSREMPQSVGLLADGAGEHCRDAVAEWADYARVDELVVAKPGVVRTFETRRLCAAVSVVRIQQERVGRRRYRVLSHLAVRLDVSFKEAPARVPELIGS